MCTEFDGKVSFEMIDLGQPTMMRYVVFERSKNINRTLAGFRYEDQAQMFINMMEGWQTTQEWNEKHKQITQEWSEKKKADNERK